MEDKKLVGVDVEKLLGEYTAATEALIQRREPYVPDAASINDVVV